MHSKEMETHEKCPSVSVFAISIMAGRWQDCSARKTLKLEWTKLVIWIILLTWIVESRSAK